METVLQPELVSKAFCEGSQGPGCLFSAVVWCPGPSRTLGPQQTAEGGSGQLNLETPPLPGPTHQAALVFLLSVRSQSKSPLGALCPSWATFLSNPFGNV